MEEHYLELENKSRLTVTAVTSVEGFDDTLMVINLTDEEIQVYGKNLTIELLDLENGKLIAKGYIENIGYVKRKKKKSLKERFSR